MLIDLEILNKGYNGIIDNSVILYISNLYFELFNKRIANPQCLNCIRDAAIEILCSMNKDKKYILFAHIPIFYNGKWYTQGTLTDEIAEKYLTENPEDTVKFKKYPKTKKGA